jgi:hypothetical protein
MSGGLFTAEQVAERHAKLVKAKLAPTREGGITNSTCTWAVSNNEDAFRSVDADKHAVFGAPTLAPHKVLGGKAQKVTRRKGTPYFEGMALVKKASELKK